MKATIALACEGRQDKGFILCNGAENVILDLEQIEFSEDYENLLEYLDKVVGIFDKPSCKNGHIGNALYKIYQYGYVNDEEYKFISHFYRMHEICGLVLKCIPKGLKNESSRSNTKRKEQAKR